MKELGPIGLDDISAARARIKDFVLRTPLVRLLVDHAATEIYLKLENLQPIGSFKLRGAANAMLRAGPEHIARGVWTPSAGNMAQGVAWTARRLGVPCSVVVPEHAPQTKLDAVARLGGTIVKVSFDAWWKAMQTGALPEDAAAQTSGHLLVHPVMDAEVIAGNGTIGLEILEDLPDVDTVLVPFGGGGLLAGIATAVRGLRPQARIFACEIETAAPFTASLAAGAPCEIEHRKSFVDGIGGKGVLPPMWPLVGSITDGSLVVTLDETCAAIRVLAERSRVVAEGAGAVPVAAALSGRAGAGKIACVVSGGNLDTTTLCTILAGRIP